MNARIRLTLIFFVTLGCLSDTALVLGQDPPDSKAGSSDRSTVVIYRAKVKLSGRAMHPVIYCNGNPLLRMVAGRYLAMRLLPGKYILNSTDEKSNFTLEAKAGEVYYIGVEMKSPSFRKVLEGMTSRLVQVPPQRGAVDVKHLQPLDAGEIIANDLVALGTAELLSTLPETRVR